MESNLSSYSDSKLDRVMTAEQFDQIVEAILSGKYSWACVLILRFAGYNPLHYIPYRTYNRLLKDNRTKTTSNGTDKEIAPTPASASRSYKNSKSGRKLSSQLKDLSYLEDFREQSAKLNGGSGWGGYDFNFSLF